MKALPILIIAGGVISGLFFYGQFVIYREYTHNTTMQANRYEHMRQLTIAQLINQSQEVFSDLKTRGCEEIAITYSGRTCFASRADCYERVQTSMIHLQPTCVDWGAEYLETPQSVRAIYLTSHAVGDETIRNRLLTLVSETEINSVVIDIKEIDGVVATRIGNEAQIPFQEERMPGLDLLLEELYEQEVYTIARIVLFKDQMWTDMFPEDAIKRRDDTSQVWKDYRGKSYVDPGSPAFLEYLIALSSRVHQMGFDEIQVDYIRFPSDGDTANTYYPHSQNTLDESGSMNGRVAVMNQFMSQYTESLRAKHPDIVLSADVFGMTTSLSNDLTIGQKLEPFLEYFDYVSPMVYPSHYPEFFIPLVGHPDNHPYEVVKKAMSDGVAKANRAGYDPDKLRPWLQDFSCSWCEGYFPYKAAEVREQIQATYDAGLDSWILWNAGSRYTKGALQID